MAGSVEADLSMGHCFEQSRLSARRSSVQLVRQNQLMKKRAGAKLEGRAGRVEYLSAQYVGGKQVRSELDPSERKIARNGHRLGKRGFADTGDVLEEQVTANRVGFSFPITTRVRLCQSRSSTSGAALRSNGCCRFRTGLLILGRWPMSLTPNCERRSRPRMECPMGRSRPRTPVRKNLSTEGRFFAHRVATRAAASWRSLWNWRTTRAG